jgi:nicotinamidase-related amidase
MTIVAREALLVMDVQNGVVGRVGDPGALLETLSSAAKAARASAVAVIYVRVAFREGTPEISPSNRIFSALARSGLGEGDPSTQIHPAVAPEPGDIIVTKRRVSAFSGSDLEVILRSLGVDSLTLTGIATSGVVLSTLRQAADMDYRLTVLRDGCADADPQVHQVLLDKVFPRQAAVLSAADWISQRGADGRA